MNAPWLQGREPRPGRLARARLSSQADIAEIARWRPEELRPADSIFACLRAAADRTPGKPAMIALRTADPDDAPRVLAYRELMESLTRAANLFHALSGGEPASVAIVLPMIPEGLIACFAAATAGIATPINPFLELHHVAGILRASRARILVTTDDAVWAKLRTIRSEVPTLEHVLFVGAPGSPQDFDAACAAHRGDGLDFSPSPGGAAIAIHMPTGGTTAAPKLARLTHGGLLTVAWIVGALMGPTEDGVVGHAMPNFHIGGTCTLGLRTLLYGQTLLTLTPEGFRNRGVIERFWDIARRHRMTSVLATPATAAALLNETAADSAGHPITDFHCGGSTVPIALMRGFHARFGVWLRENWGMTELHGTMTGHPNDGREPVIGSVGCSLPFCRTRAVIVDDDNRYVRDCAPGERGVLALGGPTLMPGYVDPSLDRSYFIEGMPDGERWGNTGDVGAVDENGCVWLFGRAKDVIIRGGHNIDPKPVEEVLAQFPGVQLAAMVGMPDRAKGELPVAYVQPRNGASLDVGALLRFCAERTHERAAIPTEIIVVEQMPLTPIGKIAKPVLRIDIVERAIRRVVKPLLPEGAPCDIAVDTASRRLRAKVMLEGASTADAAAIDRALSGFEFDSIVEVN